MNKVWKSFERTVSKFFKTTRNPLSGGASKHTCSDTLHKQLYIECKYRKASSLWTLFKDSRTKAIQENKLPVVCTKQKGQPGFLITIHDSDFERVLQIHGEKETQTSEKD
jgi:hypothetical protein